MDALVSTDWLASALGAPDVRVVDATSVLASDGRSPAAEYEAQHIPGAVFMDLGEIVDTSSPADDAAQCRKICKPHAIPGAGGWQPHRHLRQQPL